MASDATTITLAALLERMRRLTNELTRTREDSAKARNFAETIREKIERARESLRPPVKECAQLVPASRYFD